MNMNNKTGTYLASVPNNGIGRTMIAMLKRYLNKDKWHLRVRGRHPKRAELALKLGLPRHTFKRDMPLEHAETLVVYVYEKEVEESSEDILDIDMYEGGPW